MRKKNYDFIIVMYSICSESHQVVMLKVRLN
jgi:hypothetical protein